MLPSERSRDAVRMLSDIFDVNPVVVEIRVQQLFGSAGSSQLVL